MTKIRLHQLQSEVRPDGTVLWTETEIALELNEQGKIKEPLPTLKLFLAEFDGKLSYFHVDNNNDLYKIDINAAAKFTNKGWVYANTQKLNLTPDWSIYRQAVEHLDLQRENTMLASVCYEWLNTIAIREADPVQTIQLAGPNPEEYVRERMKRFHEILLAAHQKKVVSELSHLLSSSPVSLKEALRNYVRAHEQFVKAQRLDYTAIPDHPVMLLFIELAKQLGKLYGVPPIEILLPDVFTTSFHNNYPDLSEVDLASVLKTHVLSQNHRYLLPVRLITTELEDYNNFYNPYYDYDATDPSSAVITPEEWSRLWRHSPQTEALKEIQDRYDLIVKDKSTLLGQLTFLCRKFLEYGAHGGIGTQEKAAEPIFFILFQFFEYYDQLAQTPVSAQNKESSSKNNELEEKVYEKDEEKIDLNQEVISEAGIAVAQKTIPSEVCNKIETIRKQLANFGTEERQGVLTCIANHRTDLLRLIDKHKVTLDAISIDNAKRGSAIKEQREKLIRAREKLVESIEKFQYTGTDKLGLTCSMLTTLGVPLRIESTDDLALLYCFTPEELITLASDNHSLIKDVKRYVNNIENLVVFLSTVLPATHFVAFFSVFYPVLKDPLQLNVLGNFRALIISLDLEKISAVFEAMKDHLSEIIKSGSDFGYLLQQLSPEQCGAVCVAMKDRLLKIITTAWQFLNVLKHLSPDQRTVVFEAMKDDLLKAINTVNNFSAVLEYLSPDQRTVVFEAMKDDLLKAINTADNFSAVLKHLSPDQRTVVFEAMKNRLPEIITTAWQFLNVLKHLSLEQCGAVCVAMKDYLRNIITTAAHFGEVLRWLSPEQCGAVCVAMKDRLLKIITTAAHFGEVLRWLSPEQCGAVYVAMKGRLLEIITTARDFNDVLEHLSSEQRRVVFEAKQDHLSELIRTAFDFKYVLNHLSPEQCTAFCVAIKNRLPKIITTAPRFSSVLKHLSPEQCGAVCVAIKDRLPKIITTVPDFIEVLRCLSPEQCGAVCEAMKDRLPKIITTVPDFIEVLRWLSPEQCGAVLEAMKDHLPKIITTGTNFSGVLNQLLPDKWTVVCEAMKDCLPKIITTVPDFIEVLRWLSSEQRRVVFEAKQDHLSELITTAFDFQTVLSRLSPEQCRVVFEAKQDHLSELITTAFDFKYVLEELSLEQRAVVFEAMKNRLPDIFKAAYHFSDVFGWLSPEERTVVFGVMKDRLLEIIKTTDDLHRVLRWLSPEQCGAVCEAMKDRLPKIITTVPDFIEVLRSLSSPGQCTAIFEAIGGHLLDIIKTKLDISNIFRYLSPEKETAVLEGMRKYLNKIGIDIDTSIDALPDKDNLIIGAWLKEAQRLHEINEKVEHLDSYMTWLSSESMRESNTSNKELITKKVNILERAKTFLQNLSRSEDQKGAINILTELNSDQRITLLIPRSSMTASFFGRTTSPMGEKLLRNILGNEVCSFYVERHRCIEACKAYQNWLQAQLLEENNDSNQDLILAKIYILSEAKTWLSEQKVGAADAVRVDLERILGQRRFNDGMPTLLIPRSSMTASFFGRTTSPMGEKFLREVFGKVPDFSSDNAAVDSNFISPQ